MSPSLEPGTQASQVLHCMIPVPGLPVLFSGLNSCTSRELEDAVTFSKEGNKQMLPPPDGSGQTGWLLFPGAADTSQVPGLTKQPRTLASRRGQRTRGPGKTGVGP